jgi:osmotically-inducible protein OsmY
MAKKIMPETFPKVLLSAAMFLMLTATTTLASSNAVAQMSASDSMSRQDDSVQTSARHHYQSPAERAKDDLLVTEVKSDLAEDGVANDYPVAVDCDHGQIRLSGVIGSAEDARHAGEIAAGAPGVVAVVNRLTWRK